MLTNPCIYMFGDAFRVVHFISKDYKFFLHTFSSHIFIELMFYEHILIKILKLIGAYILLSETIKSKLHCISELELMAFQVLTSNRQTAQINKINRC